MSVGGKMKLVAPLALSVTTGEVAIGTASRGWPSLLGSSQMTKRMVFPPELLLKSVTCRTSSAPATTLKRLSQFTGTPAPKKIVPEDPASSRYSVKQSQEQSGTVAAGETVMLTKA